MERKKYPRAYTKRAKNPPRERPKTRGTLANRSKTSNEVATDQLTSRKRKRGLRRPRRLPGLSSLSSYLLLFFALAPSFRAITRAEPLDTQVTVFSTTAIFLIVRRPFVVR